MHSRFCINASCGHCYYFIKMLAIATSSGLSLRVLVPGCCNILGGLAEFHYQDVPRFIAPISTAGDVGGFHFSLFYVL